MTRDLITIYAWEALGGIEATLDLIAARVVTPEAGLTRMRELLATCYTRCGVSPPSTTATQIAEETR
jgi:hypothetical protein